MHTHCPPCLVGVSQLGLLAFRSLNQPERSGLQYVSDELLGKFLHLLRCVRVQGLLHTTCLT